MKEAWINDIIPEMGGVQDIKEIDFSFDDVKIKFICMQYDINDVRLFL